MNFSGQMRLLDIKMLCVLQLLVSSVSLFLSIRIMQIATGVSDEYSFRMLVSSYPSAIYIAILMFGFSAGINAFLGFFYFRSKEEGAFGPRGIRWSRGTRWIPFVSNYVLLLTSVVPGIFVLAPIALVNG